MVSSASRTAAGVGPSRSLSSTANPSLAITQASRSKNHHVKLRPSEIEYFRQQAADGAETIEEPTVAEVEEALDVLTAMAGYPIPEELAARLTPEAREQLPVMLAALEEPARRRRQKREAEFAALQASMTTLREAYGH